MLIIYHVAEILNMLFDVYMLPGGEQVARSVIFMSELLFNL